MQFIMIAFTEKRCLHFENLNVHFMSHRILTNFVSTQWPEIFLNHKVFIDRLTIFCMPKNASIATSNKFTFLSNLLYNHVILSELVMVWPGKLMVGHRP